MPYLLNTCRSKTGSQVCYLNYGDEYIVNVSYLSCEHEQHACCVRHGPTTMCVASVME